MNHSATQLSGARRQTVKHGENFKLAGWCKMIGH
jgi:hypothetical protein